MKFQIISDIHLEFISDFKIEPKCDNLILAGDIGYPHDIDYKFFINCCSDKFKNVFLILGNHEFYNCDNSKVRTISEIKSIVKSFLPENVYLLDNNIVYLTEDNTVSTIKPNSTSGRFVKIIGSTLWSKPNENLDERDVGMYNDLNCIYITEHKRMTLDDIRSMNKECVEFIISELNCNCECMLITHHGAHKICNGDYPYTIFNSFFVNYIPELYQFKNLSVCVSGHTHSSLDKLLDFGTHQIRFVSNQVGYEDDLIDPKYREGFCIEL